jgi:hypothetical protein
MIKIRNNSGDVLEVSEELFNEQYEAQGWWREDEAPAADDPAADAAVPNLDGMTRDELNAKAAEAGVADPESFPNKAALIEAIQAAPQSEG